MSLFRTTGKSSKELIIDAKLLELNECLGKGAFGVVRKGIYKGKLVAVKSLVASEGADENSNGIDPFVAASIFLQEAKNMRELHHECIVSLVGFIMTSFAIVMEYMEDGNLEEYISKNQYMPWTERFCVAYDIAQGMNYLHSKKSADGRKKKELFHQDLKTSNVLLRLDKESGRLHAKITDFGLSALRERTVSKEGSSHLKSQSYVNHVGGTKAYFSPELFQSPNFTKECDVYAYGVILLELAALLPPGVVIVDYQLKLHRLNLPTSFKQFIVNCLMIDPSLRPEFELLCLFLENNEAAICSFNTNENRSIMNAAPGETNKVITDSINVDEIVGSPITTVVRIGQGLKSSEGRKVYSFPTNSAKKVILQKQYQLLVF